MYIYIYISIYIMVTWGSSSRGGGDGGGEGVMVGGVRPHLSGADGALQGRLLRGQDGVGLLQPGEGGPVGVEVGLLVRGVQEPALEEQRHGDPQS